MPRYSACVLTVFLLVLVAIFTTAIPAQAQTERRAQFLNSGQAEKLGLPFSEAVRAGDFLYLSGQIGNTPDETAPVPGGIAAEARQALQNVKQTLERHGSASEAVIKCTVFLADMSEWAGFNKVYREFFKPPYPARSAVGVNGLALNARVEIECVAYAPRN